MARLANKVNKSKRNKLWRKKKRKRVLEMIAKVFLLWFGFVLLGFNFPFILAAVRNLLISCFLCWMIGLLGKRPRKLLTARYGNSFNLCLLLF